MTKGERWVVIEGKRYNLSSMTVIWEGSREVGTGIFRKEIFLMPRSKKVIYHNYSIWENARTNSCDGDSYHIADDVFVGGLAEETGDSRIIALLEDGGN